MTPHRRTRSGFTLIELIVALGILAIIAAIAMQNLAVPQTQARDRADLVQASTLVQAVVAFYAVNGCYPDETSSQTSPFAGAMPTGLGPYVGGPWPTTQLYGTFDQNWNWVGSGATAFYVGVIPQSAYAQNTHAYVLAVNNQAVPTC